MQRCQNATSSKSTLAVATAKRTALDKLRQQKGDNKQLDQARRIIGHDKHKLLGQCHNHRVGHWGVERTMAKVRQVQRMVYRYLLLTG